MRVEYSDLVVIFGSMEFYRFHGSDCCFCSSVVAREDSCDSNAIRSFRVGDSNGREPVVELCFLEQPQRFLAECPSFVKGYVEVAVAVFVDATPLVVQF